MTLRNIAAASLAALALAACGDDDDDNNTKPITPDTPAVPEACKAMKCVYQTEGDFKGSFVAKNEKGEPIAVWDAKGNQTHKLGKDGKLHKIETPDDGKKPGTAGEFDLSGEGVNEPIANETVHGGGIYMRGTKSKQDLKEAPQADLSPIGVFGLDKDWDQSLSNIVIAKTLDAKGNVTSVIGAENVVAENNKLGHTYDKVFPLDGTAPKGNGAQAGPSLVKDLTDLTSHPEVIDPTVDMKVAIGDITKQDSLNGDLSLKYKFDGDGAWNQSEKRKSANTGDTVSGWDGRDPVRLYGNNAWLENNEDGGKKSNFYRIADLNKVINQTLVKPNTPAGGVKAGAALPTDIAYGTLNHVQFGRVTANTSSLRDAGASYGVEGLQFAAFANTASDRITTDGDKAGTDFYFARGNNPTTADDFKALPSAPIAYHGNALVFGLNDEFHGGKSAEPKDHKSLPHSFGKDSAPKGAVQTLLGGRGNFVYAQFNPAKGTVDGSIYNVWLVGTYKPFWTPKDHITAGNPANDQWMFYPVDANGDDGFSSDKAKLTAFNNETSIKDVFPVKDDLIQFEGKVVGNTVKGDAMNYNAQNGKFAGAFFGKNAEELSGVITSNTKEYGKADDAPHWGAVFGAQTVKDPATGKTLPAVLPSLGGSSTSWLHEDKR